MSDPLLASSYVLVELREEGDVLKAESQPEKGAVTAVRTLREQIEQTRIEIEQAERTYDLGLIGRPPISYLTGAQCGPCNRVGAPTHGSVIIALHRPKIVPARGGYHVLMITRRVPRATSRAVAPGVLAGRVPQSPGAPRGGTVGA
jgi:hypothetical protein